MKQFVIAYFVSLLTFLVIDAVWLGLIAKNFYADQLGPLMREDVLFLPAAIFYLLYSAGIVTLAIRPAHPDLSLMNVAMYGAVVGFIAYGTYNITNLATIKNWPPLMTVVDLTWGTALSSIVALSGAIAIRKFS